MKHLRLLSIGIALLVLLSIGTAYAATNLSATGTACQSHTWGPWMPEPNFPTCTEPGGRVRFCTVCYASEYEQMPALGHDWREGSKKAATCVQPGYVEYRCSRCGETYQNSVPATGKHEYGSWGTDEKATCKERELQKRVCKNCGDKQWRYVGELADHQWQETNSAPATCANDGWVTYTCKVCGETKEERIPASGDHTFGEWELIQQPTRREGGTEQRLCAVCGYAEYRKTDPLPYDTENLILSVVQTSEQKEAYQPGDTITFDIELTNGSSFDYAESRVNCARNESAQPEDNFDTCQVDSLPQGAAARDTLSYHVTGDDLERGCVVLPFVGIAYFPEGFTPALPELDMPGHEGVPTVSNSEMIYFVFFIGDREPLEDGLVLSVQQTSLAKSAYKPGDVISFELTLTNISGYALLDPSIEREGEEILGSAETLEPGQSIVTTDQYTVLAEDAINGVITQTWKASAAMDMSSGVPYLRTLSSGPISPEEAHVYATPVSLDFGYKDPDGFDSLELWLQVLQTSEQKTVYQPGDVLEFSIAVANGSTVYVRDPQVYESSLNTEEEIDRCAWSTELAPGEGVNGSTFYTVTEEDAARGVFALEWTGRAALCEEDLPKLELTEYLGYDVHNVIAVPEPVMMVFAASNQPPLAPVDSGLLLEVKQTSEIKEKYAEGETVVHDLILTNTGMVTLYEAVVFNDVEAYRFEGAFGPGEQRILGYKYTVTEEDAKNHAAVIPFGGRAFTAQPSSTAAGSDTVDANSVTIVLPVGGSRPDPEPEPEPTRGEPVLALTVMALNPKDTYEVVDHVTENITYDITVENVGNAPCELIEVRVSDSGGGSANLLLTPETLYPGQQIHTQQDWCYFRTDVIPGTASETILGEVEAAFTAYGQPFDAPTLGGQIQSNTVEIRHKLTEAMPTGWVIPPATRSDGVSVTKEITSISKDSAGYQPGETIYYEIHVTNNTPYTLTDVEVFDSLSVVFDDHDDNKWDAADVFTTLLPGNTRTAYYSYTVQEKDAYCNNISNAATVYWLDPDSGDYIGTNSNVVYAHVIPSVIEIIIPPNPTPMRNIDMLVEKWIEGGPANGKYYVPGEIIHYHVRAYNNSNETLRNIKGFDDLAIDRPDGQIYSAAELEPNTWTEEMLFDYAVTEFDAAVVGAVFNEALVSAEDIYGTEYCFWSNPTIVPAGVDDTEDDGVFLVKVETSTPKNGSYYTPGEEITYDLILYNNTDHAIYMVDVYDILSDVYTVPAYHIFGMGKLEAKSSQTIPFSYTVTDADADINGYVYNIANATYNDMEDGPLEPQHGVFSNPVISPAGRNGNSTTEKEKGKPRPNPVGKLNPTNSQPDCCSFTLLDEGTFASDIKLHICGKHAPIAAQADELLAQATDKAEAWKQIEALWRVGIDEMYQELLKAAQNSIARSAVLEDQSAFIAYLGTLRAQLEQINPNDAETVNRKLATLCRDRCAELCYELNMANMPRTDSLRTSGYITLTATVPAKECQREEAVLPGADLQYRLSLCADHGPVEEGAVKKVKDARTQGEAAQAAQQAQRMWQQSLDAMTNQHYKQASKEDRSIIADNRTAFDQMLAKRRTLLEMIYPSHPEIVSEMMMQMVKDNVIFLCEVW